ncbi:hypothetical protein [Quadrisphaera sp. KR29]|uniref:hypothetical protein n=1 Tax=Quadrisphaera sp. KR29 TaxID=3461391 RepID=UPI0040449DEB
MERSRRLDDDALAEEIELYGDLVVAASEAGDVLPQAEIDRLLGVASTEVGGDGGDAADDGTGGAGGPGGSPQERPAAGTEQEHRGA